MLRCGGVVVRGSCSAQELCVGGSCVYGGVAVWGVAVWRRCSVMELQHGRVAVCGNCDVGSCGEAVQACCSLGKFQCGGVVL